MEFYVLFSTSKNTLFFLNIQWKLGQFKDEIRYYLDHEAIQFSGARLYGEIVP